LRVTDLPSNGDLSEILGKLNDSNNSCHKSQFEWGAPLKGFKEPLERPMFVSIPVVDEVVFRAFVVGLVVQSVVHLEQSELASVTNSSLVQEGFSSKFMQVGNRAAPRLMPSSSPVPLFAGRLQTILGQTMRPYELVRL
jgi:hypothetical protein